MLPLTPGRFNSVRREAYECGTQSACHSTEFKIVLVRQVLFIDMLWEIGDENSCRGWYKVIGKSHNRKNQINQGNISA